MSQIVRSVTDAVRARLDEELKDKDFRKMYESWAASLETKEVASKLFRVFCRPVDLTGGAPDANMAIYVQGMAEGAWQFHDAMMNLRPLPEVPKDLEITYGEDGEMISATTKSEKKGGK